MPEQDETREVIATRGKRVTKTFTRTVAEEMARASQKGVPTDTLLQEALNALLRRAALVASNLISDESALTREQLARIDRLQIAFSHAVHRIMEGEVGALERKGHA